MTEIIIHSAEHAAMISVFVFAMMLLIDYVNLLTRGGFAPVVRRSRAGQYFFASFLGATPGCLGSFMNVSLYIRGIISFGAITGAMVATSGDEAFVMLALFPGRALFLFAFLFAVGIAVAYFSDEFARLFNIKLCEECEVAALHDSEECRPLSFGEMVAQFGRMSFERFLFLFVLIFFVFAFASGLMGPQKWGWMRVTMVSILAVSVFIVVSVNDHYLNEHIWEHIAKKHIWRVFLWTFGAILIVEIGMKHWNLETFLKARMLYVLVFSALIGIIPESGPHMIFVMMFSKGLVPFSVLVASSIVQDGHGLLPLLSYSVRDVVRIKAINLVFGLVIGGVLYWAGL
ncbi:MAG: arsenic efflux protein [Elusimicrobia bacterium]|nr:arsenic efflux protein [Elusimicrobiota bacterium]